MWLHGRSSLWFAVCAEALLDEGFLFGGEDDLLVASTGIADGQHPDEMALAASTDSAAGAMADAAVEQGAAEDLGGGGEGGSESGAGIEGRLFIYLYKLKTNRSFFQFPSENFF